MKNWILTIEQKKKNNTVSDRTKRRNKKDNVETKKTNKNTLNNAVKYLLNDKHINHVVTDIYDLGNARLIRDNILDEYETMKENTGKGASNIASSFVLSMPSDLYHPSPDEWREIYEKTIENFVMLVNEDLEKKEQKNNKKNLETMTERQLKEFELDKKRFSKRLDIDEVRRLSCAVVHDDRNKPLIVGKTSGSHLNILMSNIFDNDVVKHISQKGGVKSMKESYDDAVNQVLKLDCALYVPYHSRPDNEKLTNIYTGDLSHIIPVSIPKNTPHLNSISKKKAPVKNEPHWYHKQQQEIAMQKDNEIMLNNARKNIKSAKKIKITIKKLNGHYKNTVEMEKQVYIENEKIKKEKEVIKAEKIKIEFEKGKNEIVSRNIIKERQELTKERSLLAQWKMDIETKIEAYKSLKNSFLEWVGELRNGYDQDVKLKAELVGYDYLGIDDDDKKNVLEILEVAEKLEKDNKGNVAKKENNLTSGVDTIIKEDKKQKAKGNKNWQAPYKRF